MANLYTSRDARQYIADGISAGSAQIVALWLDFEEFKDRLRDTIERAAKTKDFPKNMLKLLKETADCLQKEDFDGEMTNAMHNAITLNLPEIE